MNSELEQIITDTKEAFPDIADALVKGSTIQAMKFYKNKTKCGVLDAKKAIFSIRELHTRTLYEAYNLYRYKNPELFL